MEFDLPKMEFDLPRDTASIIKVIGVGGGGSNAVNHMFNQGIIGVDFIVCNTDRQALDISPVPYKIQLGPHLTEGRGAGMVPEVGMNAAIENIEEIRELLSKNTKMVFVTAGMGGGTGTGAAPVIAQVAKDLGILTVGIVTVPFSFEGRKRRQQAEEGLEKMRQNVDTLLVINNEKLREFGKNMSLSEAFSHADNILTVAAKGIAEVISVTGSINVDFNDVNTVLRNSGHAIMGSAIGEGENRAIEAVKAALSSPLLNDNDINSARYVLLNITYGNREVMMDEITDITDYIQDAAGATADVIWGHGYDASLGDRICITLIATGFSSSPITGFEKAPERKVISLEDENKKEITSPLQNPIQQFQPSQTVNVAHPSLNQEPFIRKEENASQPTIVTTNVTPISEKKATNEPENIVPPTPIAEKITHPLFDASSNIEEKSANNTPVESVQESNSNSIDFTWEVIKVDAKQNNDSVEQIPNHQNAVSPTSNPVKHVLEDDSTEKLNLDNTRKVLSTEELNKLNADRNNRIQELTAKLKKAEGIQEFENEPAYVRRNINLFSSTPSADENASRFGLSDDGTGKATLRNNNFLHDNVD